MQYNTIQYLLFKRDKNDKHALTKNIISREKLQELKTSWT